MKIDATSDLWEKEMEVSYDVSPDAIAKFALIEEVRLIASKMDRMYSAIESKLILPEEVMTRVKTLDQAIRQLKEAKKKVKRDARYMKKKSTTSENLRKVSTGSATTPDSKRNFLKSWWNWLQSYGI